MYKLEQMAIKYAELKKTGNHAELPQLAARMVESFSDPSFSFPLKKEALSNDGTTTYVYVDNATFPTFYDFVSEVLHAKLPLEVEDAKFGPGEIIINTQDKEHADVTLGSCVKKLQELVHARQSEIFSKFADVP